MKNVESFVPIPVREEIRVNIAAGIIGCTARHVRRLIQRGKLRAQRPGRRILMVLRADVDRLRMRREAQ
jgi:excisionase family DNA binding protein